MPLYLHLDVVEVCGDGTLQAAYLLLVEVVLRNGHVRLQHPAVGRCAPCAQAHVRLRMVSAGVDYLGGGLAGYGVVEAVLHHGVEVAGGRRVAVVVGAALGIDVRYLLPDAPLARSDRADALEQLAEVVSAEDPRPLLQAAVVEGEALAYVLVQHLSRPLAEHGSPPRVDAVAHADDSVEVVELGLPRLRLAVQRTVLCG